MRAWARAGKKEMSGGRERITYAPFPRAALNLPLLSVSSLSLTLFCTLRPLFFSQSRDFPPFFLSTIGFFLHAVSISRAFHFLIFAVPSFRVKCITVTRFSHGWLQLRHEHSSRLLAQQEICAH